MQRRAQVVAELEAQAALLQDELRARQPLDGQLAAERARLHEADAQVGPRSAWAGAGQRPAGAFADGSALPHIWKASIHVGKGFLGSARGMDSSRRLTTAINRCPLHRAPQLRALHARAAAQQAASDAAAAAAARAAAAAKSTEEGLLRRLAEAEAALALGDDERRLLLARAEAAEAAAARERGALVEAEAVAAEAAAAAAARAAAQVAALRERAAQLEAALQAAAAAQQELASAAVAAEAAGALEVLRGENRLLREHLLGQAAENGSLSAALAEAMARVDHGCAGGGGCAESGGGGEARLQLLASQLREADRQLQAAAAAARAASAAAVGASRPASPCTAGACRGGGAAGGAPWAAMCPEEAAAIDQRLGLARAEARHAAVLQVGPGCRLWPAQGTPIAACVK